MFKLNEAGEKAFVIDRRTWLRGGVPSAMLHDDGGKCCLGFFGESCGYTKLSLYDRLRPADVTADVRDDFGWLVDNLQNSEAAKKLMDINDDKRITDTDREAQLTEIFVANGYRPIFVN